MNVEILGTLVARQKQLNAELEALKARVQEHEAAIQQIYEEGQPIADEAKSINRDLKVALGLIEARDSVPEQEA
jgi:uncharacterized protein (DUF3084 family)